MSTIPNAQSEPKVREIVEVLQNIENECSICPHKVKCTWYIVNHIEEIEAIKQEILQPLLLRQVRRL